ncbi:unnamed protein product [Rotaria sp. Silwood1]|nr:unnamed protein product [Rotaria sp. Silwood1]CAF4787491.1 unnamed protein product [Rotaria sp. Silwood1]
MCREQLINDEKVDSNTEPEQDNQLIEQIHNELNELLLRNIDLQKESERLKNEAKKLINKNLQIQIKARLLKDKYYYRRRYSFLIRKKSFNFKQFKKQFKIQRKNFSKFQHRLHDKYEQSLSMILSNRTTNLQQQQGQSSCQPIRSSISTESIH